MKPNSIEKILARLEPHENGCLIWPGSKTRGGYGRVRYKLKGAYVHRMTYEHFVSPIPDGFELHHTCKNPACANHEHLQLVTQLEHVYLGDTLGARHASKTHCPQGHPYEGDNLIVRQTKGRPEGRTRRYCRACKNNRSREKARRKSAEKLARKQAILHLQRTMPHVGQYGLPASERR